MHKQNDVTVIKGVELRLTCGACPEQYDAFIGDEQVGYLRLRHGYFCVEVPDCGGKAVFEAEPRGDGAFVATERKGFLTKAVDAILEYRRGEPLDANA